MKNGPYILVKSPENYPGKKYRGRYVYEHQYVWWLNTGIIIPKGYQIHHKNGDKHNNSFENLEMVFIATHTKLHIKIAKPKLLVCNFCKEPFLRDLRNYNNKKNHQKNFYCSRSCSAKHQIKYSGLAQR